MERHRAPSVRSSETLSSSCDSDGATDLPGSTVGGGAPLTMFGEHAAVHCGITVLGQRINAKLSAAVVS